MRTRNTSERNNVEEWDRDFPVSVPVVQSTIMRLCDADEF